MSMSTEQALACMHPEVDETPANETETAVETPSVETPAEESKSEKDAASPEDKADKTNDGQSNDGVEPKSEETKVSDETKVANDDKVADAANAATKADKKKDTLSQRDYAFIREKNKRKEQKAKYEARIKELEAKLKEREGLEESHFTKPDGSPDPTAYVRNEFAKRDMQDELKHIREQDLNEQEQFDIEQDRIITEHCFQGEELTQYRDLIANNGRAFMEAIQENDPNNVVLNYLDTLQEYPIVLRQLMTDMPTLRRLFRSRDPEALKYNVRVIADEILEKHHAPKVETPKVEAKAETPAVETVPAAKPAIPVIGKQISSQGNSSSSGSLLKDYSSINHYLATHRYR